MPRHRAMGALAVLALLASCSPTEAAREPELTGPDEVFGVWRDHQIVCTVGLTITTSYRIRIVRGGLRAVFPAEGTPKADVELEFTSEELEALWGAELDRTTTRSIEINPTVQFEDYEVTVRFDYTGDEREGELGHMFKCLADPDSLSAP